MNQNRMYSVNDIGAERFYKLDKALFEVENYKSISLGAKVMYTILRDRQELSVKNNWVDNQKYIYFYYDCNKLSDLLNVSTNTINKYKKELITSELLYQVRQGQGRPNRLYILKPECVENALISENRYSRNAEIATLEMRKSLCNDTEYSDTEYSKTKDKDYIVLQNDGSIIEYYLNVYNEYFNKKHPTVSLSNYEVLTETMEAITQMYTEEEWKPAIDDYFMNLPENNNGSIVAFMFGCYKYFDLNAIVRF